tara:strand:+ start:588 stop:770 length:183 start_codon:yes stop_codon:yes gene_type:complete
MNLDKKEEHKLRRLREDILNIKKTIQTADSNKKIHFAQRLRLMVDKKEEEIRKLVDRESK